MFNNKKIFCTLLSGLIIMSGCSKQPDIKDPAKSPEVTALPIATSTAASTPVPVLTREDDWIKATKDGDKLILSFDQINQYNSDLDKKSTALTDIIDLPLSYDKSVIEKYISSGYIPSLPKYDNGKEITAEMLNEIKSNRNISNLQQSKTYYGVIVYRANLRSLPTNITFHDTAADEYYDRIQETELYTGMPVLVLNSSKDNNYYFIQSYHYMGWVKSDAVAITDNKTEWLSFAKPDSFITVISSLIDVGNKGAKADMGCIFPLINESKDSYRVNIPERNSDGSLSFTETDVNKKDANIGYLPYTKNNFYKQVFKYEGTAYGWGGMNDGVDCSGFVVSVFRSFGFMFPRNTSQQNGIIGVSTKLEGLDKQQILDSMKDINTPACIFKKGHVMIYLGELDGIQYVIHSPQGGLKVAEEPLESVISNIISVAIIK